MRWRHFACPDALSLRPHKGAALFNAAGLLPLLGNRASALCGLSDAAETGTILNFGFVGGRRSGRARTNYQLVYGRLISSHVYLLKDKSHASFKIGKANNILSRVRKFSWDCIDFSTSCTLSCPSIWRVSSSSVSTYWVLSGVFRSVTNSQTESYLFGWTMPLLIVAS